MESHQPLTLKHAKATASAIGISITRNGYGEYRVAPKNSSLAIYESTVYGALETAQAMHRLAQPVESFDTLADANNAALGRGIPLEYVHQRADDKWIVTQAPANEAADERLARAIEHAEQHGGRVGNCIYGG